MTDEKAVSILAGQVMGWTVAPGRFLMGDRKWIPRWRFQPLTNLDDAYKVLTTAGADLVLTVSFGGACIAEVSVGGRTGLASGKSAPECISLSVLRAMDLERT